MIERANILYPVNSTTVDSAAGIDIRLLDDVEGGATDSTQSVRFTHTQDGQERTFDPANALVTTETDPLTFQGEGWALRLADDMTPPDDTNCNAYLNAGTLAVNVRALLAMAGGTNLGGNTVITFRASLWRYNVTSNTGTLIASGSQAQTWDTSALGAENNTRKDTAISIAVASNAEFLADEILMIQIGCEGTTLPNASIGTTNFDITLDVDDASTNIDFALNQGIHIICGLTGNLIGKGTALESGKAIVEDFNLIGVGTVTSSKATIASKSFDLIGTGTVSHTKAIAEDFDLVGVGTATSTKITTAAKSFDLTGTGETSRLIVVGITEDLVGKGEVTSVKATTASKTFDLTGVGTITELHPVTAYRTFNLVGKGEVPLSGANGGTITLPLDEVPTGSGSTIITNIFGIME